MLGTSRRLNELALAQINGVSADNQPLNQEGIAEAENGANIVAPLDTIEHYRYRPARRCRKCQLIRFCPAQ
jgi:hypothetical protein